MKITWVLPQNYDVPIGGYKIVYQYANQLAKEGHHVKIIFLQDPVYNEKGPLHNIARSVYWFAFNKNPFKNEVTWFNLNSKIDIQWNIPDSKLLFDQDEKVIATAYWTANFIHLADLPLHNKFYFIQDYELFSGSEKDVDRTWQLPLNKFSVSSWLVDLGKKKFNEKVKFIPNFLDEVDNFKVTNPVTNRGHKIALLNHPSNRKNTKLGLDMVRAVRQEVPDLEVILFGTEDFDNVDMPYVKYYKRPSRKQLRDEVYNQAAVYLLPSEYEGWGLTAMEAMASGDIVFSNDNGGVNDFIQNGVNGYIYDFKDTTFVVNQIVKIILNTDTNLAMQASQITRDFSVEKSATKLLLLLDN